MAGSQKEFELLFKLKATLGGDFKKTFKQATDTQKQLRDSLKNVNSVQSKIDGFTKQSAAIEKNKQKLAALNEEHNRLQQELNETGEPTEALRRKLERNESQIQQTTARIEEQERQLNNLGEELRDAGVNTDNLTGENERLQKSYEKIKSSQETLQNLNARQQEIQQSIGKTKSQLAGTIGVIGGVAAAIYAGPIKSAQEYESALAKVSTIADSTKVPMEAMSQEIMALSNTTGIAATALADDVYNAISAGQDTADAVNFVSYSSKLAKAGFAESAQTLDVLTTILNAYGLEADKVGMVSDMLIQTQNKGKVTVAELSSVMGKIIPTAKSNGVALEQITAGYAVMTAKGIAAAETTTYMNSMLNELGKSGTTADKALRAAAGKGFKDLMAEGKSLSEVLNILQEDAGKGGKSLADVFGSAEAGKAAVTLLSDGVEGFNQQVENMRAASEGVGATQTAFELMEQTTEAKMQKAKNSISNLMTVIGQTFIPIIGDVAEAITPVITKISEFAQANPKLVATVAKVVAGLAAARVGFLSLKLAGLTGESGIISIIQRLVSLRAKMIENKAIATSSAKGIGSVFGGIAGKILPVIRAITVAITVFKLVKDHLQEIRGFIKKTFGNETLAVFDKVIAVITSVGEAIKSVFSDGNIGAAHDKIQEIFGDKGTAIFDKLVGTFHSVISVIRPVAQTIMQITQSIADFIAAIIPVIANAIKALIPIINEIINFVSTYVLPIISDLFSFITSTVLPVISQTIQALLPVVQNVLQTLIPVITTAVTNIWNVISPIIRGILAAVQTAMPIILSVVRSVVTVIGGVIQGLATTLNGIITFIQGVFTGNWRTAWNGVKQIFSGIWESLKSIAKGAIDAIGGFVGGIADKISGLIGKISGAKSAASGSSKGGGASIPGHAKGTESTEDAFIAGENGPELITGQPKKVVYTAEETKNIFAAQRAAAEAARTAPTVEAAKIAPTVTAGSGSGSGSKTITINNNPTIIVNGDKPDDLEEKLERNNQNLLQQVDEKLSSNEDEGRTRFE